MSESAASNQTFSRSSTSEYLLDQVLRNSLINSFMALDPHPCPDIIYWAADSKQLVIAQPDRVRMPNIRSLGARANIFSSPRRSYPVCSNTTRYPLLAGS